MNLNFPNEYTLISDLNTITKTKNDSITTEIISGFNRLNNEIHLTKSSNFVEFSTENNTYVTNIEDQGISSALKAVIHDKVSVFLNKRLGVYPHQKILLSKSEVCMFKPANVLASIYTSWYR